jgi:hypothetical protein
VSCRQVSCQNLQVKKTDRRLARKKTPEETIPIRFFWGYLLSIPPENLETQRAFLPCQFDPRALRFGSSLLWGNVPDSSCCFRLVFLRPFDARFCEPMQLIFRENELNATTTLANHELRKYKAAAVHSAVMQLTSHPMTQLNSTIPNLRIDSI